MRTTFINTLIHNTQINKNIYLLTADLGFKLFDNFRNKLPNNFINVGIAEQNMIGVASGLALSGKTVFCYSMVPFLVMRAFEQIRTNLCNHNLNVKLIGVGGGLSYGLEGMTHHAIEDIAIMRSLPNMTIIAPGDPVECESFINQSLKHKGPVYIRLGRNNDPAIHTIGERNKFKIGKGIKVKYDNSTLSIIATGSMLQTGLTVWEKLAANGIKANLISMPTIKPFDKNLLKELLVNSNIIVSLEEHSLIGGIGSVLAEYLLEFGYTGKFKKFALPDCYTSHIGNMEYLINKSGLSAEIIVDSISSVMV